MNAERRSRSRVLARRRRDKTMLGLCILAVIVAVVPLLFILGYTIVKGLPALDLRFFLMDQPPAGAPGGGLRNAIVGTLLTLIIALVFGVPTGILAGTFASEFGKPKLAESLRFINDVLAGVPSIVIGLAVYGMLIASMGHYSGLAGGIALGMLMIPTVTTTTHEMMRLVPDALREGALALGAPRWRMITTIVFPSALRGILTGIMLAVARVIGETAPLLFTSFGNTHLTFNIMQPMDALPLRIFIFVASPYDRWQTLAWGGALFLVVLVLILNIVARLLGRERARD